MITGAHAILYSKDPDADRAFLRDVLGFPHVDAGGGWLIFRLPPAEVAVHPSDEDDGHELYLMTDDVKALVASMRKAGIAATEISPQRWGLLTHLTLPGGGKLGVYQPRHASPPLGARRRTSRTPARPARKSAAATGKAKAARKRGRSSSRGRR
jgi:catechol 2,3-dioxygenase-like lactoylglutathione lyase family enzyme